MQTKTVRLLEGVFAGAVLGAAASMLITPKTQQKIRRGIKGMAAELYKTAAPRLKKMKKLGETEYKAFMKRAAEAYGKAKKLSAQEITALTKEVQGSWKNLTA